jgi:transposase
MRKVELYERIRRDHAERGWSVRRLAKEHRVHRREVRQALLNAQPPAPASLNRLRPVLGPLLPAIDAILEQDRKAPRKQRHTAHRIWERLVNEHSAEIAEATVRRYVGGRKRELYGPSEVMVPQVHEPGLEAEVDLGESWVEFGWGRQKVNFFGMRACASGAAFHWPLRAVTQQAFLEAHVRAFEHFGGSFEKVRYDNLSAAVHRVLQGRQRQETERFVVMRSHYLFKAVFCLPGEQGAHEKGGIEGEVGWFRRNRLVPVPEVSCWEELEQLCLAGSASELRRRLDGRTRTVGEDWVEERTRLRGLPSEPLETRLRLSAEVDQKGRVSVLSNRYSVPVLLSGLTVEVEVSSWEVVVRHRANEVARHQRDYGRGHDRLLLDHYLEVLRFKPRAFAGSLPLRQAVADGSFPACYQELHGKMVSRLGESEGARQMVDVLFLHRRHPAVEVRRAVEQTLAAGVCEFAAVALAVRGAQESRPTVPHLEVLHGLELPVPDCRHYDRLLSDEVR